MTESILASFFQAIEQGNDIKVEQLLKQQQGLIREKNADEDNCTALHWAARAGKLNIVKLLVEKYDADMNTEDDDERIPLEAAVQTNHARVASYLINKGSDRAEYAEDLVNPPHVEEFFAAVEDNNIDKVRQMLRDKVVDVRCRDNGNYKGTALHVAARHDLLDMTRVLVEEFAADLHVEDELGERAVDTAAIRNYEALADYLVDKTET